MHNVLFVDVRNAARSIMAEAILNSLAIGKGRFRAYSAGSHPAGELNRRALEQIRAAGLAPFGLASKGWNEFTVAGAPRMDFVLTVCNERIVQASPKWPGHPVVATWSLADPGAVLGDDAKIRRAYSQTFIYLYNRINIFASLPLDDMERGEQQRKIDDMKGA